LEDFESKWETGDVLGLLLDLVKEQLVISLNGKQVGIAGLSVKQYLTDRGAQRFYPAATMSSGQQLLFNFGHRSFTYPPIDREFSNLNSDFWDGFNASSVEPLRWAIRNPRIAVESSQESVQTGSAESISHGMKAKCFICYHRTANARFMPCQHDGVCVKCSKRLEKCPVCRKSVEDRVRSDAIPQPPEVTATIANTKQASIVQ
jgi:hypothetical protein